MLIKEKFRFKLGIKVTVSKFFLRCCESVPCEFDFISGFFEVTLCILVIFFAPFVKIRQLVVEPDLRFRILQFLGLAERKSLVWYGANQVQL